MQQEATRAGGFMAPIMYFVGIVAVLVAAIILKKTKPFSGKPAPFVMELPQYHVPQAKTVLLHVWERLKGFIIKAGTILFLACVVMWFLGGFGFTNGGFGLVDDSADSSLAAILGGFIAPIFAPLGFGESASSSFSFWIHSKRSNRFNNGCTCERSREPVRRYCNSSFSYPELVPKCSSSIFIPVIQPVRFPLSGSHSNDGTADAV